MSKLLYTRKSQLELTFANWYSNIHFGHLSRINPSPDIMTIESGDNVVTKKRIKKHLFFVTAEKVVGVVAMLD